MSRLRLALAAALLAACTEPVLPLRDGLRCRSDADCRPGTEYCNLVLEVCQASATLTGPRPTLEGATLDPPVARHDTPVVVTFRAARLGRVPDVFLKVGEERPPFVPRGADGDTYAFEYRPSRAEPQGTDLQVFADLVSDKGIESKDQPVGSVRFDFDPPRISSRTVTPAAVLPGGKVRIDLALSEPIVSGALLAGTGEIAPLGRTDEQLERAVTWTVPSDAAEGTHELVATIVDRAGNRLVDAPVGSVFVDRTPPRVAAIERERPDAVLGLGERLVVGVRFDEDLSADKAELRARVPAFELPLEESRSSDPRVRYFAAAVPALLEGDVELVLHAAADAVGNRIPEPIVVGTVKTDTTLPSVRGPVLVDGRWLRDGARLVATAEADEDVTADASFVFSDGTSIALAPAPEAGPRVFAWTLDVDAATPEGDGQVAVALTDRSGNRGGPFLSRVATVDRTPPTSGTALVTPALAGIGATVTVRLVANEVLSDARAADVAGLAFAPAIVAGDSAAFSAPVLEGLGTRSVEPSFVLVDAAGNASAPVRAAVALDTDRPTLVGKELRPARPLRAGDVLEATLVESEAIADGWEVLLGDVKFEELVRDGTTLVARHRIDPESDRAGTRPVRLSASDRAGNSVSELVGNVVVDFTGPALVANSLGVVLEPGRDVPVRRVSAAREGTTVRLSFALDEEVAASGFSVRAIGPTSTLDFECDDPAGTLWVCSAVVPAGASEGAYTLEVKATDLAGNDGPSRVADVFRVDRTAPAAPDTGGTDRVLYRRTPWGSLETDGHSRFELVDVARANDPTQPLAEPRSTLLVYAAAASDPLAYVGTADVDATGHFDTLVLDRTDRPRVWVAVADGAGNLSPLAPVRDVQWTVSPGAGDTGAATNPTTLDRTCRFWPTLRQDPSRVETLALDGAGQRGGGTASAPACAGWRERLKDETRPSPRTGHSMTLDPVRAKAYLYGGWTDRGPIGDLWILDLESQRWSKFEGAPGPAVYHHVAVIEPRTGRLLVAGGTTASDTPSETSAIWDPDTGRWTTGVNAIVTGGRPSLEYAVATWDPVNARLVAFNQQVNRDAPTGKPLCTWDGTWQVFAGRQRALWFCTGPSGGPFPAERRDAAAAFDPDREVFVLHGGRVVGGSAFADLWELDLRKGTWTDRTTSAGPAARFGHALAYDPVRKRFVLAGGRGLDHAEAAGALWDWDPASNAWSRFDPSPRPSNRVANGLLAWNPLAARMVLFGGGQPPPREGDYPSTLPVLRRDFWQLDPARHTWAERLPDGNASLPWPPERLSHALGYDPDERRLALHGGMQAWNGAPLSDDWTYDAEAHRWTSHGSAGAPGYSSHHLVWDTARGRRVLVGADGRTFDWMGGAWSETSPATRPPMRQGRAVAFETGGSRLLAAGGFVPGSVPTPPAEVVYQQQCYPVIGCTSVPVGVRVLFEAWRLASGAWSGTSLTTPAARTYGALTWDEDAARAVYYGGVKFTTEPEIVADTWHYDPGANAWTRGADLTEAPPRRWAHSGAYDRSRRKSVVFAGLGTGAPAGLRDVWEYTATASAWRKAADEAISIRAHTPLAYDEHLERIFVFGGTATANLALWEQGGTRSVEPLGDLWEWNGGANERGALVWNIPWAASGAGRTTLGAVQVRSVVGATGSAKTAAATLLAGARVAAWSSATNRWVDLATNTAERTAPAAATWTTTDPAKARTLFRGADGAEQITLAFVPSEPGGATLDLSATGVALDYVEVSVTYRISD